MGSLTVPRVGHAANCSSAAPWSASLVVDWSGGHESKALTVTAASGPAPCTNPGLDDWSGTHHLLLRRSESSTPPTSPTDEQFVRNGSLSAYVDLVMRSSKAYSYTVFACENVGCTSWYGDGTGGSAEVASGASVASVATAAEQWELTGISGETSVTTVVDDTDAINAPEAFFYPAGWTNAGELAFYASVDSTDHSSDPSEIYWNIYSGAVDADGWPTEANDQTSWANQTLVASGLSDSDEQHLASHPWVMLTDDGTDKRVQLFLQSQWFLGDNDQVVQIESADDVGDDFGLNCGSPPCDNVLGAGGYVAIAADGGSGTNYVYHARHGRLVHDYIAYGGVDPAVDDPWMVYTFRAPPSGTCADSGDDDIGEAHFVGYDSGTGVWSWETLPDTDPPYCATKVIDDAHDPTIVPLPGDTFKMYYRSYTDDLYYVAYWDGAV